jgi:Right handed beta helix region
MRTTLRSPLRAVGFSLKSSLQIPFLAVVLTTVLMAAWVWPLGAAPREWHVSLQGNDQWSGRLAFPNDRKTDGPFASFERARDALRAARSRGLLEAPAVVYLHAGQYELPQTFTLGKQDSGSAQAPVTFRPWERDEVILSGGRTLRAWTKASAPEVLERLPAEARTHVWRTNLKQAGLTDWGEAVPVGRRLELFFHKQPMTLARWPNEGFVKIASLTGGEPFASHGIKGDKVGKFVYEGDRPRGWTAEPEIWLHGYWFWDWSDAYQRVKSIDAATRTIELEPPYHGYGYRAGQRYYAVNLLAELDRPGEWYLDRSNGELFFWPPSPLEAAEASVSVLPTLIAMRDASWITFRGLIFEAARDTAVAIHGGDHDRVGGSVVRNTGGWGVTVNGGRHHSVIGCDIYQTGEGGVALAGGDRGTLTPAFHEAVNNHIHHFGRIQRTYRPAIAVSGVGQRVAHNLIHDGPHNAIQLSGNDHVLEGNEIHHVCFETGDVGAFYTGRDWTARGTVLRHNYFHDISGPGLYGAMAVYLDDAASGFTIDGNVFERAGRAVFIGGGRDNTVENNVFVDCHPSVHVDARGLGWMKDSVQAGGTLPEGLRAVPYTKPPWSERYPRLLTLLEDDPGAPKGNVIARNISVGGEWSDFEKAAQPLLKLEDNLVTRESPFLEEPNRRFQLPDDAPVRKLGFKPIAFEQIGLQQDAWRHALPR